MAYFFISFLIVFLMVLVGVTIRLFLADSKAVEIDSADIDVLN
jgi:hypothetical protein